MGIPFQLSVCVSYRNQSKVQANVPLIPRPSPSKNVCSRPCLDSRNLSDKNLLYEVKIQYRQLLSLFLSYSWKAILSTRDSLQERFCSVLKKFAVFTRECLLWSTFCRTAILLSIWTVSSIVGKTLFSFQNRHRTWHFGAWYPMKGHTYLNKPAAFKYV